MSKVTEQVHAALTKYPGASRASFGEFKSKRGAAQKYHEGWVKFWVPKSELGWRTIEFLAWAFEDMSRSEIRVRFFPSSAPPYLNTPGRCLAFVVEFDLLPQKKGKTASRIAELLDEWRKELWPQCRPRSSRAL